MSISLNIVWLVVHYDWEDSDVIAIADSEIKAKELRKLYINNECKDKRKHKKFSKYIKIKPYILNMLGSTIYESDNDDVISMAKEHSKTMEGLERK